MLRVTHYGQHHCSDVLLLYLFQGGLVVKVSPAFQDVRALMVGQGTKAMQVDLEQKDCLACMANLVILEHVDVTESPECRVFLKFFTFILFSLHAVKC